MFLAKQQDPMDAASCILLLELTHHTFDSKPFSFLGHTSVVALHWSRASLQHGTLERSMGQQFTACETEHGCCTIWARTTHGTRSTAHIPTAVSRPILSVAAAHPDGSALPLPPHSTALGCADPSPSLDPARRALGIGWMCQTPHQSSSQT